MNNSRQDFPTPFWLKGFLLTLPFGFQLIPQIVIADFFALYGIFTFLKKVVAKEIPLFEKSDSFFVCFLGFSFFGADILFFPRNFLFELVTLLFLFGLYKSVSWEIRSIKSFREAINLLNYLFFPLIITLGCVSILRMLGFSEISRLFYSQAGKIAWPYSFSNQLGAYLIGGFPFAAGFYSTNLKKKIVMYSFFMIVIFETGARSVLGLALFEVFLLEFIAVIESRNFSEKLAFAAIFFIFILFSLFWANEFAFKRALGALDNTPLTYDYTRSQNYSEALEAMNGWWAGVGLGCFKALHQFEVHNTPLSLLSETGIPGFMLFFIWLSGVFFPLLNSAIIRKCNGLMLAAAVLALFCLGFFHNLLRNRFLWTLLALGKSELKISADEAN
ncbi:MAG: hypothetical protein HQM08_10575 [Candidatus Riflebacteria bacterium]|nr:hypothetical protein [Candidatus Riflebacteria bacterium]